MEPTTSHRAVLRFRSDTGAIIQLGIPRARLNITEAEALSTMEAMRDGNTIRTVNGRPTAVKSMAVVTTVRTPINPPA